MAKKKIDQLYIVIQVFLLIVTLVLFFVIGKVLLKEFSPEHELIHHKVSKVMKITDSEFENDELLHVFHDASKDCEEQYFYSGEAIPERDLNELYHFLTKGFTGLNFDSQSDAGRRLVTCAILAAEHIGVSEDLLADFIHYTVESAHHSDRHLEPDAFLVYAAENFVKNQKGDWVEYT
ncbi:hypothetical protein NTH58_004319, partial [Enterobacter oligotrophicus]|nr:hypothetical protein [Enterobacter oligotrophicus]